MRPELLIHHGRFGGALHQLLADQSDLKLAQAAQDWALRPMVLPRGSEVLVVLSSPDIPFLKQVCSHYPASQLCCAFLFERFLAISPLFGTGQTCCECFLRRFLSHPPFPYTVESTEALVTLAGVDSGHEYLGFPPAAAHIALLTARSQFQQKSEHCSLIDLTGTHHQSARLVPLHGCACRRTSLSHPERFIHFRQELKSWPVQM